MRPNAYSRDRAPAFNRYSNDAPIYNDQIQNLDMELKILERQREILKQKQRQNVYNQPSSSYGHSEPKNASAYQRKGKRPFEGNWQNQSSAKQARLNPWETLYDNPPPLMKIQTNHYKKPNTSNNKPKPRNDFKSPNVIRMKDFVPKKFAISNAPKTTDSSESNRNYADKKPIPKEILRPFVEPSRSTKGRLEFALGHLTKQFKESKSVDVESLAKFQLPSAQRAVKNIIRQRISDVMMNKPVGTAADILEIYRKKYPNDVDEELIKAIKSAPVKYTDMPFFVKSIPVAESEKIKKFFMNKMSGLLKDKMTEMISKLSNIYDNESEILKCLEDLPDLEDNEENDNTRGNDGKESNENKDNAGQQKDNIESHNVDANKDGMEVDNADANKDGIESNEVDTNNGAIESEKVVTNKDGMEVDNADANKDGVQNDQVDANKDGVEVVNAEENKEDNANNKGEKEEKSPSVAIPITDGNEESNVETVEKKPAKSKRIDQYYKLMDLLIAKRLPTIMENFKDDFVNLMLSDKEFVIARQNVIAEMRRKLKIAFEASKEATQAESTESKPSEETSSNAELEGKPIEQVIKKEPASSTGTQKSAQLFVMLLGRPSLPSKFVIYEFLNKFNPLSIKKHKTVNNLLVIGFNNEEDYNNILAANESKVGDATFIIKANEVIASEKPNESTTTVNKEISDENVTVVTTEATNKVEKDSEESNQDITESCEENNEDDSEDVKIVTNDEGIIDISEDVSHEESAKREDNVSETKGENMETIEDAIENSADKLAQGNQDANGEKEKAVATPTRSSSRLANIPPSLIKTRRASRLAQ